MTSNEFSLPPLLNGLDYIRDTIRRLIEYQSESGNDLKYAILHLSAAIEVIAKYRLLLEHWTLVVSTSSLERTTKDKFDKGEFQSVSGEEAFRRLRDFVGLPLQSAELETIRSVQILRNKLQHFGLTASYEAVEGAAVRALGFLLDFLEREVEPQVAEGDRERFDTEMEEIRSDLGYVSGLIDDRMDKLASQLDRTPELIIECPTCRQVALRLEGGGETFCLFCTRRQPEEESVVEYTEAVQGLSMYEAIKDGAREPTAACPDCSRNTVAMQVETRAGLAFSLCFSCGMKYESNCTVCDALIANADDGVICSDCLTYLVNKDE